MGQKTDEIENHIQQTRDTLGANLNELEHKVKAVTDWKQHFQKNPMTMLGVALGGGVLLATMIGGRRGSGRHSANGTNELNAGATRPKHEALETWDNIKGALMGVCATRFTDYVSEFIPGFKEHFHRAQAAVKHPQLLPPA